MGKYGLVSDKHKDGFYHFYWNGRDITGLWMDFFSGLNMKDEVDCERIFIRKYGKHLNRQYPPNQRKK